MGRRSRTLAAQPRACDRDHSNGGSHCQYSGARAVADGRGRGGAADVARGRRRRMLAVQPRARPLAGGASKGR